MNLEAPEASDVAFGFLESTDTSSWRTNITPVTQGRQALVRVRELSGISPVSEVSLSQSGSACCWAFSWASHGFWAG